MHIPRTATVIAAGRRPGRAAKAMAVLVACIWVLCACDAPPGALSATFPATATVGQTAPVTIAATNTDTAAITLTQVKVLPSCGAPVDLGEDSPYVLGCPAPDLGVFALAPDPTTPLSGQCGTATGFTVAPPDTSGIVTAAPTGGTLSVPAGGTCILHLVETTLRLPATDVDPTTPGVQTNTGAGAFPFPDYPFEVEGDVLGTPATVTVDPAPRQGAPTCLGYHRVDDCVGPQN